MKKTRLLAIYIIVLLLGAPFAFNAPAYGASASLYLSPKTGNFNVGDTITVRVLVDSGGAPGINASDATLSFDSSVLSGLRASKDGSIFNLWTTEPKLSSGSGTLSGGSPSAFTGNGGMIAVFTFKALKEGTAKISVTQGSVLAADGQGTDILSQKGEAVLTIGSKKTAPAPAPVVEEPEPVVEDLGPVPDAPKITSATNPDENKWYPERNPKFAWELPKDITAVRTLLDKNEKSNPTVSYVPPVSEKTLENLEDGIHYLHVQFKNQAGWGKISHRKIMVDSKPPKPFAIDVKMKYASDNYPILLFNTEDELSGVAYYEVKIGNGEPVQIKVETVRSNPYRSPFQGVGSHGVVVKAFDAAGNVAEAQTELVIEESEGNKAAGCGPLSSYAVALLALAILLVIILLGVVAYMLMHRKQITVSKSNVKTEFSEMKRKTREVFKALKEEVTEQTMNFDKNPHLSESEKKVAEKLGDALDISEEILMKEMDDIEKALR